MTTEQLINKYIFGFFILLIGIFIYYGLHNFLNAFLGSVVFYALFKNFMRYLTHRRKLKKPLSAVIIILISFIIVVLPVSLLIGMIYNKIYDVTQDHEMLTGYVDKLTLKLKELPFEVSTDSLNARVKAFVTQNAGTFLSGSFNVLGSILMMYFFLYFLLVNTGSMEAKIVYYLPFKKSKIILFGKELVDQTYSNAIGVPLVCVAQGCVSFICYMIAGVPDAVLWAVLTGVASIIPLVGTGIIWVPVSVFLLADGRIWQGFFVAGYCIVLLSNVDNLVRMVVSKRVGDVHPLTTILGVIIGLQFFGLPGLVFGPLVISYFLLLLKLFYLEYAQKPVEIKKHEIQNEQNLVRMLLNKMDYFNPVRKTR